MAYIGAGITRFNTADELTVTGDAQIDTTTLVVDSTNNRVGIGTSSPSTNLEINGGANNNIVRIVSTDANANIEFADNTTTSGLSIGANGDNMKFGINGTEAMRITGGGNVGISTSGPIANLEIEDGGTSNSIITKITADDQNPYALMIGNDTYSATDTNAFGFVQRNDGAAYIYNAGSLRAVIDSSGNVLVGTTDNSPGNNSGSGNDGIALKENGSLQVARTDADAAQFNRLNSNGDIALFRKDGSTVGSVGTSSGNFFLSGASKGFRFGSSSVVPSSSSGADSDNNFDLGYSSSRFKDLYLGGNLYIGGTGSSNALDDYEEGTWTPSFENTIHPNPTVTYTSQIGTYTKVGNRVHWTATIRWSAFTANGSGYVKLVGFPFTSVSTTAFTQGANVFGYANGIGGSDSLQGAYIDPSTNFFYLNTSANPTAELQPSNVSSAGIFFLGGCVQVS